MAVQKRNDEMVNILEVDFARKTYPLAVASGFAGSMDIQVALTDGTTITLVDSTLFGAVDLLRYDTDVTADTSDSRSQWGMIVQGESVNLFSVGSDTVQLRLTAGGNIEIQRTAGTASYSMVLRLRWLTDVNSIASHALLIAPDFAQVGERITWLSSHSAFVTNDLAAMYSTSAAGGAYPFLENNNLIIQARTSTGVSRDIILAAGNTTPTPIMVISRLARVGVNNSSPLYPLHVGAGADTLVRTETSLAVQVAGTATATLRDASTDTEVTLISGGGAGFVGTATDHPMHVITNNATVLTVGTAGELTIKAGASANREAAVGGVLYTTTTAAGNVGTGEDDLASYSVPASTLATNNDSIYFEASGTAANNADTKTLRVRFGSGAVTQVFSLALTVSSSHQWVLRGRIYRTGAATQKSQCSLVSNFQFMGNVVTTLDHTLSGAAILKVTAEGVSNNDVVLQSMIIGWDSANT